MPLSHGFERETRFERPFHRDEGMNMPVLRCLLPLRRPNGRVKLLSQIAVTKRREVPLEIEQTHSLRTRFGQSQDPNSFFSYVTDEKRHRLVNTPDVIKFNSLRKPQLILIHKPYPFEMLPNGIRRFRDLRLLAPIALTNQPLRGDSLVNSHLLLPHRDPLCQFSNSKPSQVADNS